MLSIFLIGFMGSGKTTFGRKLASLLKMEFVDLDEKICAEHSADSIRKLIDEKGFGFFRKAESRALKSLAVENKVVSTGGGTPCYFDNMDWMKSKGVVVFLNVNEGVLLSRLATTDMEERPLLKNLDKEGLKGFIHDKLRERLPFYTKAHITFDPVNRKMEELVKEIMER